MIEALEDFASRSGTLISPSALSRFLRDMFGQRPEPWVELDTVEVPDGVTVTSEPIPGELAISVADDFDLGLEQVPKLVRPEPSGPQPVARDERRTAVHQPAVDVVEEPPARRAGWQVLVVVASAAFVGSALMWIVMSRRMGSTPPVARDAAVAAIETVEIDAAPVEPPVDAAVVAIEIDAAPAPVEEPPPVVPPKKKPPPVDESRLVINACKAGQTAKARALFAKLERAKRKSVAATCRNAGVDVDPPPREKKPKQDPCEVDPMSCQH